MGVAKSRIKQSAALLAKLQAFSRGKTMDSPAKKPNAAYQQKLALQEWLKKKA